MCWVGLLVKVVLLFGFELFIILIYFKFKGNSIFKSSEFGEIRTQMSESNEPLFCLKDVAKALGISNHKNIVGRLNPKGVYSMDTLTTGGKQSLTFINESNLYKCIFMSRKEKAQRFTDWVTSDVLPSIRKNGLYVLEQTNQSLLIWWGVFFVYLGILIIDFLNPEYLTCHKQIHPKHTKNSKNLTKFIDDLLKFDRFVCKFSSN